MHCNFHDTTCLIETGATVAVSHGIVVVVRNYLMDFVSISMSKSVTSMSNSVTSMSTSMTYMPKTSMANARASMVTNRSMSSTEATDLGRGGSKEDRDANEDLEVKFLLDGGNDFEALRIVEPPSFCELSPNSAETSLVVAFIPRQPASLQKVLPMQLNCSHQARRAIDRFLQ